MWLDYIRERTYKQVIEKEKGFAIYFPHPSENAMYIEDIYVLPEFRNTKVATELLNEVIDLAKIQKLKYILGSNCPNTKGATSSMKAMLASGFELYKIQGDLILLRREV